MAGSKTPPTAVFDSHPMRALPGKGDRLYTILLIIVVRLIVMAVGTFTNRRSTAKTKGMCNQCAYAHIQFGACGRRAISCTFGGGLRPLKLDVLYCTDYRSRYAPARPAMGFVRQIARAE